MGVTYKVLNPISGCTMMNGYPKLDRPMWHCIKSQNGLYGDVAFSVVCWLGWGDRTSYRAKYEAVGVIV